jgi:hypothetical protein
VGAVEVPQVKIALTTVTTRSIAPEISNLLVLTDRQSEWLIDTVIRPVLIPIALLAALNPVSALVGGAPEIPSPKTQPEVMLVGSKGNFCTGTAIARDLVLTAAHCIATGVDYKLVELGDDSKPLFKAIVSIARHPQFSLKTMLAHRATADVALLKLQVPHAGSVAPLMPPRGRVAVGERFIVRGYGASIRGDGHSAGRLREAALDPASDSGKRPGLGGCTGDSGAPVYQKMSSGYLGLYGVVSWSTASNFEEGCGGVTGVTPIELYHGWIEEQGRRMGSTIGR